jgi:hypothetical protein
MEIFASQGAPPVSLLLGASCPRYQRHQRKICHQQQRHWRQIFATSSACVVDTGGKFATVVNDTGSKFAAGGKFPLVSTTPAANLPLANNWNNIRLQHYFFTLRAADNLK